MRKKDKLDHLLDYDILIKITLNGAVVEIHPFEPELRNSMVYEFDETNKESLLCLMYDILDLLSPNSKHNKYNIELKLTHGSKYECKDKNCKICKNTMEGD